MKAPRLLSLLLVFLASGTALGTPTPVTDILYARPFTLQHGYWSSWHRSIPLVTSGHVVVLAIDPEFGKPQAGPTPVLLAGDGTVEEFNFGYPSGIVVAIIPGTVDLTQGTLMWFGPTAFADQMTDAAIAQSKSEAIAAGITPFPASRIIEALAAGGAPLVLENRAALMQHVLPLVQTYAGQ